MGDFVFAVVRCPATACRLYTVRQQLPLNGSARTDTYLDSVGHQLRPPCGVALCAVKTAAAGEWYLVAPADVRRARVSLSEDRPDGPLWGDSLQSCLHHPRGSVCLYDAYTCVRRSTDESLPPARSTRTSPVYCTSCTGRADCRNSVTTRAMISSLDQRPTAPFIRSSINDAAAAAVPCGDFWDHPVTWVGGQRRRWSRGLQSRRILPYIPAFFVSFRIQHALTNWSCLRLPSAFPL
jgi:hypothetical protein